MNKLLLSLLLLVSAFSAEAQILPNSQAKQANYPTMTVTAFGSLSTSFSSVLANASGNPYRSVDISNTTDALIYISFDNSNNHYAIPANSSITLNFYAVGLHEARAVFAKYVGSAPTVGNIYASAAY